MEIHVRVHLVAWPLIIVTVFSHLGFLRCRPREGGPGHRGEGGGKHQEAEEEGGIGDEGIRPAHSG